jgi:hypothetical protein
MRWRMSELTGEVEVRVEECKGRRRVVFLNNQEQRYAIFHSVLSVITKETILNVCVEILLGTRKAPKMVAR